MLERAGVVLLLMRMMKNWKWVEVEQWVNGTEWRKWGGRTFCPRVHSLSPPALIHSSALRHQQKTLLFPLFFFLNSSPTIPFPIEQQCFSPFCCWVSPLHSSHNSLFPSILQIGLLNSPPTTSFFSFPLNFSPYSHKGAERGKRGRDEYIEADERVGRWRTLLILNT